MVIMLHWLNMVEPSSFGLWFIHVYSQSFLHIFTIPQAVAEMGDD